MFKRISFLLLFTVFISVSYNILATVSVTYPIASTMVLQRNMPVPIWGTASSGESVQVTFNGQVKSAVTGTDGKWKVVLDSMVAAGPLTMTIKGTNTVTLSDIYVGEVWNCAGQSNMDLRLYDYVWNNYNTTFADTIAAANNPLLRYIDIRYTSLGKNVGWHAINSTTASGCSATGYFFGQQLQKKLGCAVGLVVTAVGGTYVEAWLDPATIAANPGMVLPTDLSSAGGQYNSFVAPVVPFAIRGTISMLGEQNSGSAETAPLYGERFKQLITGWRAAWGQGDFPFYYGGLTMFDGAAMDTLSGKNLVREGQRLALTLPNTGMAVMFDLSASQWHFPNKYEAGRRLALLALSQTYGYTGFEYTGPEYQSFGVQGSTIRIHFDHATSGLSTLDGSSPNCFYVAGDDNVYYPATNTKALGDDVTCTCALVPDPKKICYGYGKTPYPNVRNTDGLVASPFRSEQIAWKSGINQIIYWNATLLRVKMGTDFDPGATCTSGLPITYESSDTTIAKFTPEGKVHPVKSGNCTLYAYQKGDATYRPSAKLSVVLNITKNSQTIEFNAIPSQVYGNEDMELNATATSGLEVSYTSSDEKVATIISGKIHLTGAGSCTITATQSGDINYNAAASKTVSVVVGKAMLQVQVVDTARLVNNENPDFRLVYSGFVNNDTPDNLDVKPVVSCTADLTSPEGDYPVIVSGGNDASYDFEYQNGTLKVVTTMGVNTLNGDELKIYPTYVTNSLIVEIEDFNNKEIMISDLQERLIFSQPIITSRTSINTGFLSAGIYMVKISDDQNMIIKKIVKL